ncbi:MAG: GSCFA domain-containing protein [Reichenbachiella sp.]
MRKFSTEVKIESSKTPIQLGDSVLSIGSCFADSMGVRLSQYKFDCLANPFGILFNPVSIVKLLTDDRIDYSRIVDREGVFCHLDYHFDLRSDSKEGLIDLLEAKQKEVLAYLSQSDWLIVTLGTSHVYEWVEDQEVVANCHKLPQRQFVKRLLSLDEMVVSFENLLSKLNSKTKLLLTVSPVRHAKDGLVDDQMSKSLLRVMCGTLSQYEQVSYFPSYEIMNDELRDYRYYKDDMLHPTALSEELIWDSFVASCFGLEAQEFVKQWKTVLSAIQHRPFNPESSAHQSFLLKQIEILNGLDSVLDVSKETEVFKSQLI